jgi:protein tyrosine/serine phosphatase
MKPIGRAVWIAAILGVVVVGPILVWRMDYYHGKRLHEILPGRIYRSGQLTVEGFDDAIDRLGLHTIVNLQDDCLDPDVAYSFWDWRTIKESEYCARRGVRYVVIEPDLVSPKIASPEHRPHAVDQLLKLLDDESNYPVLLHCRAGLHRTGVLSAVVRMEYQGWTTDHAFHELKANGFGEWVCSSSNLYVAQYVLNYKRGLRFPVEEPRAQR